MGKNLIQQRRGKGSIVFRSPGHRMPGNTSYIDSQEKKGIVNDIIHSPLHSAPLAEIIVGKDKMLIPAVDNIKVGSEISIGDNSLAEGAIVTLSTIPEGTEIFNIESNPGDGGKLAKAGGTFARVVAKTEKKITIMLPSKKQRDFHPLCRATIGRVAGHGRTEKPMLKAGVAHFKMKARNRFWPRPTGQSMNAVAHPHGGKRSSKKNYSLIVPRSAPPGAKAGKVSPRRTGRKR